MGQTKRLLEDMLEELYQEIEEEHLTEEEIERLHRLNMQPSPVLRAEEASKETDAHM